MGLVRWKQIERGENFLEKVNKIEKEVKETSNPSLDGYEKPAETSAISPNDSVQEAIGKLEKAMDEKQDAGDYLASDGVAADSEKLGGAAASKYAKLASPTFTGTPKAPTPVAGTNTEQIATTAFVMGALSTLVNSAPETLDTLKELAAALGNDPNFSATVMELIGQKLPLAGGTITGDLTVNGKLTGNLTGNADSATKVNGHTVNADVPSGAKFSDTVYTHPTTAGNKHIPSGGSSGQILRWSADGTATWGADNNTTYSNFVKSGSGAAAGLVPAPSTTAGTTKYLREDGTWSVPPDNNTVYTHPTTSGNKHIPSGGSSGQILRWSADGTAVWGNDNNTTYSEFVKSGSGAKAGLVPSPGTTAGTTKYLREDGTWAVPPDNNTTYVNFVKSGSGAKAGLVPAPSTTAGTTKYLREDGTWQVPPDNNTIYTHPTTSGNKHIPSGGSSGQILRWSADGTAAWGADNNTTYSNFVKSGSTAAAGLVPAPPTTAGTTKYLREDGTWQVPPDNNTTYTAASAAPKAAGTAAVGTSAKYAREDHVHPLQTSVSGSSGSCTGNAATASKAAQLTTARTIDGVSFNGTANITHYGSCSTEAATVEKTVACTGFTLAAGAKIAVKFTVTNTAANPTLNVQSTGAKPIYYRGAAISAGYLAANRTYEFIYNGTQYELVGDLDTNTNSATAQNVSTANSTYPVLLGATANATANIGNKATLFGKGVKVNPSTSELIATKFTGALNGNANTASKINGKTILTVKSFDSSTGVLELTSLS